MSEWITHDGGPAPVRRAERVDVRWRNGEEHFGNTAEFWVWTHSGDVDDVVAYRLAQPEPTACEHDWFFACDGSVARKCGKCGQKKWAPRPPPEPLARDMTKRERMIFRLYRDFRNRQIIPEFARPRAIEEVDALLAALEEKHDDA